MEGRDFGVPRNPQASPNSPEIVLKGGGGYTTLWRDEILGVPAQSPTILRIVPKEGVAAQPYGGTRFWGSPRNPQVVSE